MTDRPEDWSNPHLGISFPSQSLRDAYESGADAMLEAILVRKSLKDRIQHILWDNEPYMPFDMCLKLSVLIMDAITEYINDAEEEI